MLQPRVTDISHHNTVTDLRASANAGLWGVIHKATQGTGFRDKTYNQRRQLARAAGLLWGAYHFGDSSDPAAQVENFLSYAKPDAATFLSLDYEDHPQGRTMRPNQMVAFLREIERRTGRKALLYGGNRIKEDIDKLGATDRAYVTSHLLWLCQYGNTPKLPQGFRGMFLWQYTDGVVGPQPRTIPGIQGHVDLNAFNGTRADLERAWITQSSKMVTDFSSQERTAPRGDDDNGPDTYLGPDSETVIPQVYPERGIQGDASLPPFLTAGQPSDRGLNVQPVRARFDVAVKVVQTELDAMGYHEVGDIDGKWGGKTAGAIRAFFNDRGIPDRAEMGALLNNEITQAKADGWTRPIAPSRANATPAEIAPKVETVRVSLWGRFTAKIAAGFAAVGLGGSTVSSAFQSVQDTFYPVRNFFAKIPPEAWFILMGIVACSVWYVTNRAAKAATKDYNTGRLN